MAMACMREGVLTQDGKACAVEVRDFQPDAREGQAGPQRGGGDARNTWDAGQRRRAEVLRLFTAHE